MTISPIQSVGSNPSQGLQQMTQLTSQKGQSGSAAAVEVPASHVSTSQSAQSANGPGFMNSVLDNVYSEIDKLSQQLPAVSGNDSPVDAIKNDMAAKGNNISPMEEAGIKDNKHEAVSALSKTFDHAIFMAMVNQVVSGVSDTSRTLIRQS